MKLLICTQTVDLDDPVLGFFHAWIEAFARHAESVDVVCLRSGTHALPQNVRVHSLGKEAGAGRFMRAVRFFALLVRIRSRYDIVFAHMNPEYVIAGAPLWRLFGKEIGLWYAHGAVTFKLRLASRFAHHIFTSTPEGYGLRSSKCVVVGQGIDTDRFRPQASTPSSEYSLVSVSRISRSKDLQTAIDVVKVLKEKGVRATLTIVGTPLTPADHAYEKELKDAVAGAHLEETVSFVGAVRNTDLPHMLAQHRFLINAYKNKSLDKVLLESMAVGVIPVSSNAAYCALLASANAPLKNLPLCVPEGDARAFAESILAMSAQEDQASITEALRNIVVSKHGIQGLVERIMSSYRLRV